MPLLISHVHNAHPRGTGRVRRESPQNPALVEGAARGATARLHNLMAVPAPGSRGRIGADVIHLWRANPPENVSACPRGACPCRARRVRGGVGPVGNLCRARLQRRRRRHDPVRQRAHPHFEHRYLNWHVRAARPSRVTERARSASRPTGLPQALSRSHATPRARATAMAARLPPSASRAATLARRWSRQGLPGAGTGAGIRGAETRAQPGAKVSSEMAMCETAPSAPASGSSSCSILRRLPELTASRSHTCGARLSTTVS